MIFYSYLTDNVIYKIFQKQSTATLMKQTTKLSVLILLTLCFSWASCSTNAYEVLGLSPGSSKQQIRNRFKELSLKFHPDRNPQQKQYYQNIVTAYQSLKDQNQSYHIYSGTVEQNKQFQDLFNLFQQIQWEINMMNDDENQQQKQNVNKMELKDFTWEEIKRWSMDNSVILLGISFIFCGILFIKNT